MVVTNCARRTLLLSLSPMCRPASKTLSSQRTVCRKVASRHGTRICSSGSNINPQRRYLSAPKKSKQPSRKKQQQQQQQQQQAEDVVVVVSSVPRWATTASVLVVPFMFAAWGVSDWLFGNRNKGHNEDLRQLFLKEVVKQRKSFDSQDDAWLEDLQSRPTLFHCVIRKTNSGMTHCLSGVRLGDVVEILEEGVGPNQEYNLCRLPAREGNDMSRDTYGWFPIRWLQKLQHYESIVQEQRNQRLSKDAASN